VLGARRADPVRDEVEGRAVNHQRSAIAGWRTFDDGEDEFDG
jgi:hypothetical protein